VAAARMRAYLGRPYAANVVQESTPDTAEEKAASLTLPKGVLAKRGHRQQVHQLFSDHSIRLVSTPAGLVLQIWPAKDCASNNASLLDIQQKGSHAVQLKYMQTTVRFR
jgi:hypothetical protein